MVRIDREYAASLIREVKEGLEELRSIVVLSLEDFMRDRSKRFAIRYSVILIVEASADLGVMILKQCFGEEARSYREVFLKLGEKGVLSFSVAEGMASLASLRNMIVHRYWGVDDTRIYREAKASGVSIVEEFIREVEEFVSKDP